MAYTVGSASVDIVPDFKNAQLAITAFFNKQRDGLTIPVKLDIDRQIDSGDLERQAQNVGSRVSKAMSDGAAKNQATADKLAIQQAQTLERAKLRAHGEALRIQAKMDRDAERLAEQIDEGRSRSRVQAHMEALRLNAQMDRENARRAAEQSRLYDRYLKDQEKGFRDQIRMQITALREAQREASRSEKIRLQVEIDQRRALLAGREAGGLVTRAMREELHQNAGLIAGAIGAVLALGAPAAIGGAVALFAGIGAVAAAQSERVKSTYIGLWSDIKSGAQADAASLVPVFQRSAGQIGQAFEEMRPLIRRAFEASGPHIESFTSSILKASQNALPGLVHAVEAAGPTVAGLGELAEKTGSGVGAFFENLSTHSFAAGRAASSLGDAIEALLPTLAELLGQGAETAAVVLPVIAGGFRGINTIISATGDLLPQVLTAFLAFRAVQGIGRFVGNVGVKFGEVAAKAGPLGGVLTRAGSALTALGPAFAVAGVAAAAYGAMVARNEKQIADWTETIMRGGAEARRLRDLIGEFSAGDGFDPSGLVGNSFGEALAEQYNIAEDAARRLYAAMTPLEKAQHDLDVATRALQKGMEDENTTASELARLKANVASAAARQAREEENLERATKGVTEAMAAQADAARARVDSAFGYQQALIDTQKALLDVTEAQADLDKARAEGTPADIAKAELDLKEALLGVNDALSNQVKLAGEAAISKLPAAMDETQKSILGAKAELDELNRVIAEGTVLPPELEAYRQQLINITGGAGGATLAQAQLIAALGEVGAAVEAIPDSADVKITAPTDEVKARLEELGFTVTEIPGTKDVVVSAETDEAKGNLGNLSALLAELGITVAEPTVDLNTNPFAGQHAEAKAKLVELANQRAVPSADLNSSAFAGKHASTMAQITFLHGQRPTPNADLNSSAFAGKHASAMSQIVILNNARAIPVATLIDNASGAADKIMNKLAGIQSKTVTVTVVENSVKSKGAIGGSVTDIIGNTPRFAVGGPTTGAIRYGRGGPWDDGVDIRVSPGEHVLDYGDVVAMGGQEAVYDFRRMLHSGYFNAPGQDNAIQQMVTTGAAPRKADAPVQSSSPRSVALYTPDIPAAMRALKAQEHEEAALAPVW